MSVDRARKDAAEALLKQAMRGFPWDERGFPAWALGDGDSGASFVIVRYQARRLLLALVSEFEAAQREAEFAQAMGLAEIAVRDRMLAAAKERVRELETALRYCMNAYCGADDLDGVVMIEDRPLDDYITESLTTKGTA